MRLQIKTTNQKTLVIEIEENKTVFDLKTELSHYADVGINPEQQKLVYAGRVMDDEQELSSYNIDQRKYLVVLKTHAIAKLETASSPTEQEATAKMSKLSTECVQNVGAKDDAKPNETETLVTRIIAMGYDEAEVRQALAASFNNPERAIEYLIEGIPSTSARNDSNYLEDADDSELSQYINNAYMNNLSQSLSHNPQDVDAIINMLGCDDPTLLNVIAENQEHLLNLLLNEDEAAKDDDDKSQHDEA